MRNGLRAPDRTVIHSPSILPCASSVRSLYMMPEPLSSLRTTLSRVTLCVLLFTVFLAAFAPAALFAANLTRGPYLQVGRPDGVTIRWRTNISTNSRVEYGLSPDDLDQSASDNSPTTEHEISLTGLESDTKYYYSVGSSSEVLASGNEYTFRTSPPPGTASPTRIWILGDSGEGGQAPIDVRDAYSAYPGSAETDVWLMLGDNAYDEGTDSEYQSYVFDRYPTFLRRVVLWSTRGNHEDIHSGSNNDYYEIFTFPTGGEAGGLPSGSEAYYSFDHANIHFICLDSEGTSRLPSGAMLEWLELDLEATSQPWIIAFWHHPPYSKGSHDSDDAGDSGGRLRDMRENALPILEQGGVDLVLSGHSHSYERSFLIDGHYGTSNTFNPSMLVDDGDGDPSGDGAYEKPNSVGAAHEGAVYNVTGCSSEIDGGPLNHPVMVTSLNVLGSTVIDVNGPMLDAVFLDSDGDVRDHFQIMKEGPGTDSPIATELIHADITLSAASPNPFSSHTIFEFSLPTSASVQLVIFDVAGRRIATLIDGPREKGRHHIEWNAQDASGRRMPSGTYFVQLESNGEHRTQKVSLLDAPRN